jgi:hypothetical protein
MIAATLKVKGTAGAHALTLRLYPTTLTPNPSIDGGFFANWVGPGGIDPQAQVIPVNAPGQATGEVTITDTSEYKAGTTANTYDLRCPACRA